MRVTSKCAALIFLKGRSYLTTRMSKPDTVQVIFLEWVMWNVLNCITTPNSRMQTQHGVMMLLFAFGAALFINNVGCFSWIWSIQTCFLCKFTKECKSLVYDAFRQDQAAGVCLFSGNNFMLLINRRYRGLRLLTLTHCLCHSTKAVSFKPSDTN